MISFLHCADLHLGMRITRFDPLTANKLREARFDALENVLKAVREQAVDFVLVAGDLFDDLTQEFLIAQRTYKILDEAASVPVFVLPGNHDPLMSGGVWDRPPWTQPGKRLRLLREAKPVEVMPGVRLFPCPVLRKTSMNDPTAWIAAERGSDELRIGVAHGSLRIREDLPADDHLIARHAAADKQLDYLALGHWHGRRYFPDPDNVERTAYAGVHEPMRFQGGNDVQTGWVPAGGAHREEFLDSGKGEVLRVRIRAAGDVPEITPLDVGRHVWKEEQRDLSSEEDLVRVIQDVANRDKRELSLLRLRLTGFLDAATMLRLSELREILQNRYFVGELDDAGLHIRPSEDEVKSLAGQGVLGRVLARLQAESGTTDEAARQLAERAVLLLHQLAREVQG